MGRIQARPLSLFAIYLSGKPQPTLGEVHKGELAHWVDHRVCRLDVPVRPHSEFIASHLAPGFMVTTSVGDSVETSLTGERMGERGWLLKRTTIRSFKKSVAALGKSRMGTPGLRGAGGLRQPGIQPNGWYVLREAKSIECDLTPAVKCKIAHN
jgi:hypothetical protein